MNFATNRKLVVIVSAVIVTIIVTVLSVYITFNGNNRLLQNLSQLSQSSPLLTIFKVTLDDFFVLKNTNPDINIGLTKGEKLEVFKAELRPLIDNLKIEKINLIILNELPANVNTVSDAWGNTGADGSGASIYGAYATEKNASELTVEIYLNTQLMKNNGWDEQQLNFYLESTIIKAIAAQKDRSNTLVETTLNDISNKISAKNTQPLFIIHYDK